MRFGQLIGFLALVISLYILWQIRQILLVVFAAVVLATALNQLVSFFSKISYQARNCSCHLNYSFIDCFGRFFCANRTPSC